MYSIFDTVNKDEHLVSPVETAEQEAFRHMLIAFLHLLSLLLAQFD